MFSVFVNAWKVKDIRKKLIYIAIMLAVYRVGCHIYLPGINAAALTADTNFFNMIAGGGQGSIFAMGIAPYITTSIIIQLLCVAIPKLEQMQKEGEEGRKKINQITRYTAVGLALLQGSGTVYSLVNSGAFHEGSGWLIYITATASIVTGTMFIMWMGELLTEKAIGNGTSFIIFANILSQLPAGAKQMIDIARGGSGDMLLVILVLAVFVAIIAFVVLVQDGERRIPVQYSKKMVGHQMYGGQSSFIPIKVNIAGVMSIIFAISLQQLPQTLVRFFPNASWLNRVNEFLSTSTWHGAIIYVILIFCFTFFYTSFAINPIEMAENMKKNGGFVPGIRPGKPTSDYIQRSIHRLSWVGAAVYALIALIPIVIEAIFNIPVGFGGTTLLIVVGVALEVSKQLESQLLMRHYKGFLSA